MDWSELSHDILRIIIKKVGDIASLIRFRAVCKHWQSSVDFSELPQQLPYFVRCKRKTDLSFDIEFGPLFGKESYTWPIQNSQLKGNPLLYGSLTPYVLIGFVESSTWLLLNPLTGFQVLLPFGVENYSWPVYFGPSSSRNSIKNEIDVLFSFKQNNLWYSQDSVVCLWRYADGSWTKFSDVFVWGREYLRYSNRMLYAFPLFSTKAARVIDVITGKEVSVIPFSSMGIHYLTEGYGDVFGVERHTSPLDVFQLENTGTKPCWVKVNDIGDRMLFLDSDGSSICLKANDFDQYRGSTIYFTNADCYVFKYDMKTNTQVPLHLGHSRSKCFVPSIS